MAYINFTSSFDKLNTVLARLDSNTKAVWGQMDAHQMIEHLILVVEISNGLTDVEIQTPEKYIAKSQAFLMSDEAMPKNFIAKFIPEKPQAYKYVSIDEAKKELLASIKNYNIYWMGKELNTRNHPVFGKLNKEMWDQLHSKHFTHHFEQFDVL